MIGLDTNILVRYLTKDNEQQWEQSVEIVEGEEQCFVANIVICELSGFCVVNLIILVEKKLVIL